MLDSPTSSRRIVSGLVGCSVRTGVGDAADDDQQSTMPSPTTLARQDSKVRRPHAHSPPRQSSLLRLIAIIAAFFFALIVSRKVKPPLPEYSTKVKPPLPENSTKANLYVSPIPESAVAAAAKAAKDITDTAAATFGVAGAAAADGAFEKRRQRNSRRDDEEPSTSSSSSKLPIPRVGLPDPAKSEKTNNNRLEERRSGEGTAETPGETEEAFLERALLDDVDAVDVERLASSSSSPNHLPPAHLAAKAVKAAAAHAWAGYVSHAWGEDELAPVSREGYETFCSLAVTAVDALDTLWLMGMKEEFQRTRAWLLRELPGRLTRTEKKQKNGNYDVADVVTGDDNESSNSCVVSVFEATIRVVGGLASAADLTGDGGGGKGGRQGKAAGSASSSSSTSSSSSASSPQTAVVSSLGDLAALAAERLLPAFRVTPSSSPDAARLALPFSEVDLATGEPVAADVSAFGVDSGASGNALLAEAGSLAPEFWRAGYWRAVSEIQGQEQRSGGGVVAPSAESISSAGASAVDAILRANDFRKHPLPPTTLRLDDATAAWIERRTVGGRTDSYYEYLLKMHLMLRREAERMVEQEEEKERGGGGNDGGTSSSSSSSSSVNRRAEEAALSYITSEEDDGEEKHHHHHHHNHSNDNSTKKRTTTSRALALSRRSEKYRQAWLAAVDEVLKKLVKETPGGSKYLTSDMGEPVMEHLACFFPGNLALGVMSGVVAGGRGREQSVTRSVGLSFDGFNLDEIENGNDENGDGESKRLFQSLDAETKQIVRKEKLLLDAAAALAETCARAGETTALGLAPEVFLFLPEIRPGHPFSLLRPEAAESFFYLWRATRDPKWRLHGWKLFVAIDTHAKIEGGGFSGVRDVTVGTAPSLDDSQPSWLLAETFKYLYLLFSEDDVLDLGEFVLNTEAHPLRVFGGGRGDGMREEEKEETVSVSSAAASEAVASEEQKQQQQRRRRQPKEQESGSRRHLKPTKK